MQLWRVDLLDGGKSMCARRSVARSPSYRYNNTPPDWSAIPVVLTSTDLIKINNTPARSLTWIM